MSQKRKIVGTVPNLTTATTPLESQSRQLIGVLTSVDVNKDSSQKRQFKLLENILTLYKNNNERLDQMQKELKDLRQLIQTLHRPPKRAIHIISSSDSSAVSTDNSDSDELEEMEGEILPRPKYVDTQLESDSYEPSDIELIDQTDGNDSSSNGGHSDRDDSDNDHNGVNLQQRQEQPRKRNGENAITITTTAKRKRGRPSKKEQGQQLTNTTITVTPKKKRGRPSKKEKEQEQQLKKVTITSPGFSYTLNRYITSVQDIWREYTVGLTRREPAVKYLTKLHVTEFYINEREPIITEIIKIMDKKNISEFQAVCLLENHRIDLDIDIKDLAKRIMVHRSIDEERGLPSSTFV